MCRNGFLFGLLLLLSSNIACPQSGSISGIVTDSVSGYPVANLSVFFPFTTIGTTTNAKGEYVLDRLPPGDYTLMFRHVSYQTYSVPITIEAGKQKVMNLAAAISNYNIDEVVKTGGRVDFRWGYDLFKRYFLGDPGEVNCILKNPDDLKFYYDGHEITAFAKKPLIIVNRHLGYRITFFLDYFRFVENNRSGISTVVGSYYAFSGSALYEDLAPSALLNAFKWRNTREAEFTGSLKHFLACLYNDKLIENRYTVRKVYKEIDEIQKEEKIGLAMAKVRYAMMDSVFFWNPESSVIEFLNYFPDDEYRIGLEKIRETPGSGIKTLTVAPSIIIFRDLGKTKDLKDDWTFSIQLPDSVIEFDREGNYGVPTGEFIKTDLNNSARIRVLLPLDYLSADQKAPIARTP
ncbi:MAG: carboxypeptidase-like regulatory domain-containing protein [Bacteroidota bacterium]